MYEEEDFQPLVYNFKLCEEISPHKAGAMLREVEDDLQRVLRSTKSKTDAQQSKEVGLGNWSRFDFHPYGNLNIFLGF